MSASSATPAADGMVLSPPEDQVRLDDTGLSLPTMSIDYPRHPAYEPFAHGIPLVRRMRALLLFIRLFSLTLSKRLIDYELIPAHVRSDRSLVGRLRFLRDAARNALSKVFGRRSPTDQPTSETIAARLARDGIAVVAIEPALLARLETDTAPFFERLRVRRGKVDGSRGFDESRSTARRDEAGRLFATIDEIMVSSGILGAISRHIGRPASLVDVNPQINDASDDFWRRIFPDLPPADRPAKYLHRDASGGDIKAIIYMSDVGSANGPFSYCLGSHRVRHRGLRDWIGEANDMGVFSGTSRESRELFAALPRSLQSKCSFGNDLLPSHPAVGSILGSEWIITAPKGHVVLFDTKGLHRGGMVDEGERMVVTCVTG